VERQNDVCAGASGRGGDGPDLHRVLTPGCFVMAGSGGGFPHREAHRAEPSSKTHVSHMGSKIPDLLGQGPIVDGVHLDVGAQAIAGW